MRTRENGVNTAFQITDEAADERVNTLNKCLLMQKGGLRTEDCEFESRVGNDDSAQSWNELVN